MSTTTRWPCRATAICAVATGTLLMLGGFGHLSAVLESRAGQAFDYRFVSLLTTSGILIFPGLVAWGVSYALWKGRVWAYTACLLSTSALMVYLGLLMIMKTYTPDSSVGSELYFMTAAATLFALIAASTLVWLQTRD